MGLVVAVGISLAASAVAIACGTTAAPPPPPAEDIIGIMELPLSHRNGAPAPQNATKIEVSPTEMRVDGTKILTLSSGAAAGGEVANGVLSKLRTALTGGAARRTAALHVHAATPWKTTHAILATLLAANIHEAYFRVRKPGTSSDTGWLEVKGFSMAANADDPVDFANTTPMPWPDFANVWEAVQGQCTRVSEPLNCSPVPEKLAPGGRVQIVLRARGDGVKLEFYQVQVDPTLVAPTTPHPVQMMEGVPQPQAQPTEEEQFAPSTDAQYTLRQETTTRVPSPISAMMRPVCGSRACGALAVADPDTMSMRILSLLGAAFPDGTAPPTFAFVVTH